MALYLVSYDLHVSRDYRRVIGLLERSGAVKVLESTWLLNAQGPAASIRDELRLQVDADDSLFVVELKPGSEWAGRLTKAGSAEWLRANVRP
jgi:CRISPR/Cas system-associated endoribonuclease Cas2